MKVYFMIKPFGRVNLIHFKALSPAERKEYKLVMYLINTKYFGTLGIIRKNRTHPAWGLVKNKKL